MGTVWLMNRKISFLVLSVLFLGTISVFAGNVFVSESGISATYSSSGGSVGDSQNVTYKGEDDSLYVMMFEDGIFIGVANESSGGSSNSSWWNSSWGKRKEITIGETSGTTLTNYSVLVNVSYEAEMQSDFDDLRFVLDGEVLSYYIEDKVDSGWAGVYVKVPQLNASSDTVIEMYYGNGGVSGGSNITDTFIYGNDGDINDFSQITTCTPSLENGTLKFVSGSSWSACGVTVPTVSNSGYMLDYDIKFNSGSSVRFAGLMMADTTLPTPSENYANRIYNVFLDNNGALSWGVWDDADTSVTSDWELNTWININQNVDFSELTSTTGVDSVLTNADGTEYSYTNSSYRPTLDDVGRITTLGYLSSIFWIDNIIYREKASSEPTITFGAVESE